MMRKRDGRTTARALLLVVLLASVTVSTVMAEPIRVTYIAAEAVYVNAGKVMGLAVGDTLAIVRNDRVMARLVIINISSHSAACRPLGTGDVQVGDVAAATGRAARPSPPPASAALDAVINTGDRAGKGRDARREANVNRTRGYLSMDNEWQHDLTGQQLDWVQPSVSGKLVVENIAGHHLAFRMRHRSRLSIRSNASAAGGSESEWTHRLSEAAFFYGDQDEPFEMGVGRLISPYVSGLGYIDGGYVAARVGEKYHVGTAFGTEPDIQTSEFRSDHSKLGGFITYETGSYENQRLASTLALSGSYTGGYVNREFVYLQNAYSRARKVSIFQSVEIDVNRSWRRAFSSSIVSFSNFFLTSNIEVGPMLSLDASFDARRNVRIYDNKLTPDSLFDDSLTRGFNGGFSARLPKHVSLRANAGVRYGESDIQDIKFASVFINIMHFLGRGHSLTALLSRSETSFTTGYRPVVTYRFPWHRRTTISTSGGAYLYRTANLDNNNYYFELGANRTFGSRYYFSSAWRQYTGGSLKSLQMSTEIGVTF